MAHDVFISYSSKDKPAADAACAVLEAKGVRCWIAPRDIVPGADWGHSIIDAINRCKLMVLIFSQHANESQQVKREVERIIHRGLPLIPVRIEDVLPAQAMEFFLATPHRLDAFTPPLEQHLDHLAAIVQQILTRPQDATKPALPRPRVSKSWRSYIQPICVSAAVIAGLTLLAMIALRDRGDDTTPSSEPHRKTVAEDDSNKKAAPAPSPPAEKKTDTPPEKSRPTLAGQWQADMTDDTGKKFMCQMDMTGEENETLTSMNLKFSDECPFPFCCASLYATFSQSDMHAENDFQKGKDTGTFFMNVGSQTGTRGTYRLDADTLVMTYPGGSIRWRRIKSEGPLHYGGLTVVPADAVKWPVKDVPGMAKRGEDYIRSVWQKDAQLWRVELTRRDLGNLSTTVDFTFEFTSATAGKMLRFQPRSDPHIIQYGDTKWTSVPIPPAFLDFSDAIASKGLNPKQVSEASLRYEPATPKSAAGLHWRIKTDTGGPYVVRATQP
jgi:hypothetical protein